MECVNGLWASPVGHVSASPPSRGLVCTYIDSEADSGAHMSRSVFGGHSLRGKGERIEGPTA